MTADLEREQLALKAAANALNQKANLLILATETVMEYRQLTNKLLGHCDVLRMKIDEAANPNGGTVPGATQPPSQPDSH